MTAAVVPDGAAHRPWALRRVDLDVAGHVNNAACWTALVEVVTGAPDAAELTHHGPLEWGDDVVVASTPGRLWLVVGDEVRVSGRYRPS